MEKVFKGRVAWIFEDNFDVDMIIGIENISVTDLDKILDATMKSQEANFKEKIQSGDILVGGKNFGYGHPHPQSMIAMRKLGITTIIAESFAFPFYRSELASGMKLIECPGISSKVSRWDNIVVDFEKNIITNENKDIQLELKAIPEIALNIMDNGGIVEYLKNTK
jgi:3-isopropylmalate/(R)-2-methylmalate dehydratase small subunit